MGIANTSAYIPYPYISPYIPIYPQTDAAQIERIARQLNCYVGHFI